MQNEPTWQELNTAYDEAFHIITEETLIYAMATLFVVFDNGPLVLRHQRCSVFTGSLRWQSWQKSLKSALSRIHFTIHHSNSKRSRKSAVEVQLAYMWWHEEKFVSSFTSKLIGLEQQLLSKASVARMGVQCGSGDPGQMELRHLLPTDRFLLILLLSPLSDLGTGLVWDNPTTLPLC